MGPWSGWRKPGSAWRRRGGWRSSRGRASPSPPASPPSGTPRGFGKTSTPGLRHPRGLRPGPGEGLGLVRLAHPEGAGGQAQPGPLRPSGAGEAHPLPGGSFLLVTQNVDGLHALAGSQNLVELHGNLLRARCEACGKRFPLPEAFAPPPFCPACGHRARPDVVWFGEFLPEGAWERAERAFAEADFALVVGTSAEVEPAASLGRIAFASGAYLVEVNPEPTPSPPGPPLLADGGGGGDGATPPSFPGRPGGRAPLLGPGPRRCGFSGSSQRPG